jgi:glycosyltransferase involved in cell wall biosynthesis
MNNPLVSVIMPVYNGGSILRNAIESIVNQTYKEWEFIIIDDGSTDNTEEIIKEYKDNRIRYVKQSKCGVTLSLNKGIGISKGEFIARQDADDISLPTRLEKQINFLKENKDISLLGTFTNLIDKNGRLIETKTFPTNNEELQKEIKVSNPFIHGSIVMKKESLKEVGLYREQFFMCQSYDLWLRISEKCNIAIYPEALYNFRIWEHSYTGERMALNNYLRSIASELAEERRLKGKDILDQNNFEFYMKYGEGIVESFSKKEKHYFFNN